jgi:GAF domain-containing protein
MHEITTDTKLPKPALYAEVVAQTRALLEGERDAIANFANTTSLLYHSLPDLNWVGVYLLKDGELVVGPFQGKPACVRIALGKGVCGTAAARRATVIVKNVHEFDGHIACDSASNSEIVVPLLRGNELIGVLDLDSPKFERFDAEDQAGLEQVVAELLKAL